MDTTVAPKAQGVTLTEDVQPFEEDVFFNVIDVSLSEEQTNTIENDVASFDKQKTTLAVHWHPEFVPMESIRKRIENAFPKMREELIIPTDHNVLGSYNDYTGVEIDCYSPEFDLKVQLLCHFKNENVENADTLKSMLRHTANYRGGQLFEFMETIINEKYADKYLEAVTISGADEDTANFVKSYTKKLSKLYYQHESDVHPIMVRNKMLTNYIDALSDHYPENLITRSNYLLKTVKKIVKRSFSTDYFYKTQEIIEEVKSLGGCIVIPHPEQFWPILMADYDVDGYEIWNPQSRRYTQYLIDVVHRENQRPHRKDKPIIITMGDDTHFGEKTKPANRQIKEKASRQVGYQPAWEDLNIRKILEKSGVTKENSIRAYKERLEG